MEDYHFGYVRVSSAGQNTDRQLADVEASGIKFHRKFEEKASGKDTNRPALKECLATLRDGDTLHIHSIDRLARSVNDLNNIVKQLTTDMKYEGVTIIFHKENLTLRKGGELAHENLLLNMLGAIAQFEKDLTRARCKEGREIAKAKGVHMGRKAKFDKEYEKEIMLKHGEGMSAKKIAEEFGASRATIYRIISKYQV